ncbi:unnamed protein product [Meloidogyne enterolobii]|uniref:Uncharacterized protein n=1 Tax=Meloidogyne enterolobii TaxID=390850 RepID=A0ACB0ZFF9_MELEN
MLCVLVIERVITLKLPQGPAAPPTATHCGFPYLSILQTHPFSHCILSHGLAVVGGVVVVVGETHSGCPPII